jgi:putative restriction endonuclease
MTDADQDTLIRMAAFEHVRRLGEVYDHLTATELKPGFVFGGERIPLMNPQRGIFKPQQMRFLLSIKTVFPKPGGKVWYDDQREVHRQTFAGDEITPLWGRTRTLPTIGGFAMRATIGFQLSIS